MTETLASIPWSSDLHSLARRHATRKSVNVGAIQISYAELNDSAHALATHLLQLGVQVGEPVGVYLPNGVPAVQADYGVTISGACLVHLNPACTLDELRWCAHLVPMRYVITDAKNAARIAELGAHAILCDEIHVGPAQLLPPVPAESWSRIIFSSGTTGKPKAIVYSHGRRWLAQLMLRSSLPFIPAPGSRILLMTPYVHGASMQARAWLDYGGEAILLNGIDVPLVKALLQSGTIDALFAPPTVIAKLGTAFPDAHFDGIRCLFTGTQTLTPALYETARRLFGDCVRVTYGKSENLNPITVLDPTDTSACFRTENQLSGACLGWPAGGVELQIAEDGEILVRSRHMYIGHIDGDGMHPMGKDDWHHTGDLGCLDERGCLWLLGRKADVIKTGGYKVYPDEVEGALSRVQGCDHICVVSLPSDYWGEIIVAVSEGPADSLAWVESAKVHAASLARYKQPRAYVTVGELPRNATGKISRQAVREQVLQRYDLQDGPYPALVPV